MHSWTPLRQKAAQHSNEAQWRALVLGGARSGKSAFAERLLADDDEVLYAATAPHYDADDEWAERIARHRQRRPASWGTVELGQSPAGLADLLIRADRTVLVDSLTLWLTAAMDAVHAWDDDAWREGGARQALDGLTSGLVDAFENSARSVVLVSDEVGFGVVPESAGTRRFRDELGRLNQAVAAVADEVSLVVAGIAVRLKPGPGALGSG
ncbi:bifunctional adenosylcobinamide kinase/adenosylcobinamide-phosphate guanylyltransferase [Actinocrinis puniceicyclus]|uniref:Adenosylcobinamide kinase n=1 Tax=Actinocrinis puniceicyclus TaxID=977794 RepID=A0A8J7WQ48_9ACTN|nr:bifunctional adenosylcobinamide kinase/adenosylcobinamide-phosphate guanylyltransferase [Actinocrinis puniceicyclus]MBS2963469.1 bifunctional adenosylcobinamide kinase/adenosylcobinamide-phosphate guanylyltransferase [Actinocrinis puniceicyclus]